MKIIDLIRYVNGKALTVRAALQIMAHKRENLPGKIVSLDAQFRNELG